MTSYRRRTPLPSTLLASESGGAYDPDGPGRDPDDPGPAQASPLGRLAERLQVLERAKLDVLDAVRDVAAWAGTANTTGYTRSEYVTWSGGCRVGRRGSSTCSSPASPLVPSPRRCWTAAS